ncbi:Nuclear hormone receptor FTZ-F1 [Polyplax serrata]|uniref:Nuclear hormone receptor FTZ-F1 n=1 Tax=Polyplax serrata TaxID=468196 RepID=A0AAN8NVN0_POLSC
MGNRDFRCPWSSRFLVAKQRPKFSSFGFVWKRRPSSRCSVIFEYGYLTLYALALILIVKFCNYQVDDQMKLLQHSWSDMLVLDHLHQRMHNNLPDETTLPNGQKFDLLCLGLLGVPTLADHFTDLTNKLQDLKFDVSDYICVKFLLLLNPDVRGISNRKHVQEGHEQVLQALLDYTLTSYPHIQDKFTKLQQVLPEIHQMASRGEDHLYHKHCSGGAPTQTLLMEMLHAKRK